MSLVTPQDLEHLVQMAGRAPSVHNTQPWRFVPVPDGVEVHVDRSRQLAFIDAEGREMFMSCGAALHHLLVAARAMGLDAVVELLPESDTVASVRLTRGPAPTDGEVADAVAILHRHTYRGRFDDRELPLEVLDELGQLVDSFEAGFRVVRPEELVEVEVVVSRAEQALRQSPAYGEELARWVWHGDADSERADGLPPEAVEHGQGRAESLPGRRFDAQAPLRPEEPAAAESQAVVLLSTEADTRLDWVRAGQALSALLLRATERGVVAQPIGQVIDVPSARHALGNVLGIAGSPQMLLRLGTGHAVPTTPRRPVRDVVPEA